MHSLIFIVLAHWNMSLHSDTLFWFRANQSLLFLLNIACLVEKQQIPILKSGLTRPGFEPMFYRTWGEHANHYATDAFFFFSQWSNYSWVILRGLWCLTPLWTIFQLYHGDWVILSYYINSWVASQFRLSKLTYYI